jgi:hypothetical protein
VLNFTTCFEEKRGIFTAKWVEILSIYEGKKQQKNFLNIFQPDISASELKGIY